MADTDVARDTAFGQEGKITAVDRSGVWLSGHQIRRTVGGIEGKDVGDFGCGFQATYMRTVLAQVRSATLVDISLADDLKSRPKVTAIEGTLPGILQRPARPVTRCDLVHVRARALVGTRPDPDAFPAAAAARRRVRRQRPSWRGKRSLEFSAFRLGLLPASEMDDHKRYYDPRDLWPLLVAAGFLPHGIRCFKHKFGLNTFAVCKVDPVET